MGDGQASPTFGSAEIALPWIQSGKCIYNPYKLKELRTVKNKERAIASS